MAPSKADFAQTLTARAGLSQKSRNPRLAVCGRLLRNETIVLRFCQTRRERCMIGLARVHSCLVHGWHAPVEGGYSEGVQQVATLTLHCKQVCRLPISRSAAGAEFAGERPTRTRSDDAGALGLEDRFSSETGAVVRGRPKPALPVFASPLICHRAAISRPCGANTLVPSDILRIFVVWRSSGDSALWGRTS